MQSRTLVKERNILREIRQLRLHAQKTYDNWEPDEHELDHGYHKYKYELARRGEEVLAPECLNERGYRERVRKEWTSPPDSAYPYQGRRASRGDVNDEIDEILEIEWY